jgi:hypothetical protein
MRGRHPDIGHHQLRGQLTHQPQQLNTITGQPHHIKTRPIQQAGQTLPQQHIILSHHHPHPGHPGAALWHRGRAVSITALIPATHRHSHPIHRKTIATLSLLIAKVRSNERCRQR